jgi:hypothetical protein
MNLPVINPRVGLVQRAESEFLMQYIKILDFPTYKDLDYGDLLKAYNQITINLVSNDKMYQNDFQKEMENMLEEITNKYQLTVGEKLTILTKKSKGLVDEIVRWERNK